VKSSVTMYHKQADQPVQVHPSQVENMQINGWSRDAPAKIKPVKTKEAKKDG